MSSNKFSRLLSAVSQNTLYTETCKTVKKNVKEIYDNYNESNEIPEKISKKLVDNPNNKKIKYITDIKYTIINQDTLSEIIVLCELPGVDAKSIKMMFVLVI